MMKSNITSYTHTYIVVLILVNIQNTACLEKTRCYYSLHSYFRYML